MTRASSVACPQPLSKVTRVLAEPGKRPFNLLLSGLLICFMFGKHSSNTYYVPDTMAGAMKTKISTRRLMQCQAGRMVWLRCRQGAENTEGGSTRTRPPAGILAAAR